MSSFEPLRWSAFLGDRGVDAHTVAATRLTGGEVNDNWRLTRPEPRGPVVLRHYRATVVAAELDCELAAVALLSQQGFPTPAPIPGSGGQLWAVVDGRPAALFTFAAGQHPPRRAGGYGSMDLALGVAAAALVARMHQLLAGADLPGSRSVDRDPWHAIGEFLGGEWANHPVFAPLVEPLRATHELLAPAYADPAGLPIGVVHADVTPVNLLVDESGAITALLDFDDCKQTFLAYEIACLVGGFGRDDHRRLDPDRMRSLIDAYDAVRPLTARERELLPDLLAAYAGAEGVFVLTTWLRNGRPVSDPMDSYSARLFLDFVAAR